MQCLYNLKLTIKEHMKGSLLLFLLYKTQYKTIIFFSLCQVTQRWLDFILAGKAQERTAERARSKQTRRDTAAASINTARQKLIANSIMQYYTSK